MASPHPRGWTFWNESAFESPVGFPAPAGMDPRMDRETEIDVGLPRTRGDGPMSNAGMTTLVRASPHPRGWTRLHTDTEANKDGFPAPAGMDPGTPTRRPRRLRLPRTRGDGPRASGLSALSGTASPHPRGWTRERGDQRAADGGFPAPAGMDPRATTCSRLATGLPRTRGDGPEESLCDPTTPKASPHPRGWTPAGPHPLA